MTVPAEPADAEILAEYQRRIDDGDPIPSQRSLVERYGMGFPRARRLVDELKRRKATAVAATVTAVAATVQREAQTEGDGAVAEVAGELIDRIHARTEAVADAVERQTNGAVRHEAAAPHRTAERAPAAPERPRNGAVGAVRPSAEPTQAGAAPVELHRTGPRPVHRNGAPAPQAHRLPVQGAPVDGAASASEADQPAEQATPSSTTAVGAPVDGEPAPTSAPPALAALERVEADTPADDTSRAEIGGQHANGRVFRGPVVHTVSAQMPGVSEADQSAEEATAPSAAEVATPVDGEPAPTAPQAHRLPVQGAPPRTAGGAERTGSEDQTGVAAPPVHEGGAVTGEGRGAGIGDLGAVTAVRPGDEGGAAAPEQPVTPAGDPGAGASGAGTGEGHQPAERGEVRAAVGGLAAAALRRMRRRVEEGPQRDERDADESGGTLRGWHVAAALVIAVPAFLAVWSGWIGLGEMTGWGERNMLPGLVADGGWATIHTSITLPIGIEAFGALSMAVWLASRNAGGTLARYAACCTFGSLALGAFGQVSYHVLTAAGEPAPGWLVGFVAVLPVIVLGASVGLIHLAASNRKRG